jgi:hypothetical protein
MNELINLYSFPRIIWKVFLFVIQITDFPISEFSCSKMAIQNSTEKKITIPTSLL